MKDTPEFVHHLMDKKVGQRGCYTGIMVTVIRMKYSDAMSSMLDYIWMDEVKEENCARKVGHLLHLAPRIKYIIVQP